MNKRLEGKVAVVTGASKGIGAAIAIALAVEGASVVVNYASSQVDAEAVVKVISQSGGKAVSVRGDVSKGADAAAIIEEAIAKFGQLDILVNNAGVYSFAPLQAIDEDHFHQLFNINTLGLLLVTQAAAKHLGEGGSIINIGASITTMTPPGSAVYSATKAAAETITSVLAKELGPRKIRINSLNPGPTETEGAANMTRTGMSNLLIAQTPLGRLGQPEDIAKVAVFLASNDSSWITGQVVVASGGLG